MLQQRAFEIVIGLRSGFMAEFLDRKHRSVVIEHLVDGDHHAHLEQRLDHFAALECEPRSQIGHADALANRDIAHHRRGRPLEAVRAVALARLFDPRTRHLALAGAATRAIGIGQMQLAGETIGIAAVIGHRMRAAHRLLGGVRGLAVFATARLGLRGLAWFVGRRTDFLGRSRSRWFDSGCFRSRFDAGLARGFLRLQLRDFLQTTLFDGGLAHVFGSIGLFARDIQFALCVLTFELLLVVFLDMLALHVGALLAHFDIHRGLALARRDGEFLDLAPIQGDLPGRGLIHRLLDLAMGTTQEAEKFHLLGAGHHLIWPAELHAGLGKLFEQLVDRRADHRGESAYGNFGHSILMIL